MFAGTYATYLPYVTKQTRNHTRNPEDALEISQEIFLKIWGLIKRKLPTNNDLRYWFIVTTRSEIKKFNRQLNRDQKLISSQLCDNIDANYTTTKIADNPEARLQHNLQLDQLNEAITTLLTPIQQEIATKYQAGYKIHEIANQLQITTGQTRGHLQRLKNTLRIALRSE